ncbi:hydroxymethylbilane synthase [Fusibacter ferrireducens]|uniref:Porphobilinogen deaminase n=1 Tax=Fusibacter ferrireducens TaxID=2785058 RepID=A0ABR9ZS17_9FIRM|nr:hydroxymethylbilane synthase [Fusibacter ferrireducens]MBF4693247.1 hydroxymethylbilane synthase [Fusibacter ferrireducens]
MKTIKVGTRGSRLARAQTNWVIDALKALDASLTFETIIISTKGDEIQNISLDKIGDKGLFVKEIEQQLLNGHIDIAVHSMKDMPSDQGSPLAFSKVPKREDPRDVLSLREGYTSLDDLPLGARIGTGSKRRLFQLLKVRPDIVPVAIRGNVETRLSKIEKENLHGVILAAAGLHRLDLSHRITQYLDPKLMIPAPAQGALALQYHQEREDLKALLNQLSDEDSDLCVRAERAFLKGVNGSCHIPMGAYAVLSKDKETLEMTCVWGTEDGSILKNVKLSGSSDAPELLGQRCADAIKEA